MELMRDLKKKDHWRYPFPFIITSPQVKCCVHTGTWVQLEKQIRSEGQSHFIMLQCTNRSGWEHTGASDNDIRWNQPDHEMRHDHTVSCLQSVVAVSTQKMALDTTLLHSDNNPSIPVAFCLESFIQWRQNPAQNLILARFEEQNKLCAAVREAPSSLYKYTTEQMLTLIRNIIFLWWTKG